MHKIGKFDMTISELNVMLWCALIAYISLLKKLIDNPKGTVLSRYLMGTAKSTIPLFFHFLYQRDIIDE